MTALPTPRRPSTPHWLRRLLRTRTDRLQNLWSTLLLAATLVACGWIATAEVPVADQQPQRLALSQPA